MKGQSKKHSLLEAVMNIGSGMLIAFTLSQLFTIYEESIQLYFYSDFHWNISASSNLIVTVVLTIVSICRSYIWRRIFNHCHLKLHQEK